MINEVDDNHALVVHPRATPPETQFTGQRFDQLLVGVDPSVALQEQLRLLRQQTQQMQRQLNEVQETMRQSDLQGRQMQHQINGLVQRTEQSQEQTQQLLNEIFQKTEQSDHVAMRSQQRIQASIEKTSLKIQHLETGLQELRNADQRAQTSQQQQLQQQVEEVLRWIQESEQQERGARQRFQEHTESACCGWIATSVALCVLLCIFISHANDEVRHLP